MKKWKRFGLPLFLTISVFGCISEANAQEFVGNTDNATAVIVRDPARQASTEIDAAIYNPAGTAFLENGFHLSLNGNASFQNGTITDEYLPMERGNIKKKSFTPSMQMAWKKDKWAISASFANEGGFGKYKCNMGSSIDNIYFQHVGTLQNIPGYEESQSLFEDFVLSEQLIGVLSGLSIDEIGKYISNKDNIVLKTSNHNSSLTNYTGRIGVSYSINSKVSVYLGAKINWIRYSINTGQHIGVQAASTNQYYSYSDYFKDYHALLKEHVNDGDIDDLISKVESNISNISNLSGGNSHGSQNHKGGIAPIVGFDFHGDNYNIGAKYEFKTSGDNVCIPASLSIGANWDFNNVMRVALGGTLVFNEGNKFGSTDTKKTYANASIAASLTYSPTDNISFSAGARITNQPYYMFCSIVDLPISLDNTNFNDIRPSIGVSYRFNKYLSANIGANMSLLHNEYVLNTGNIIQEMSGEIDNVKRNMSLKNQFNIAAGINVHF